MPNWERDESDSYTCEHCHRSIDVDSGFHLCAEGAEESRKATEDWLADYMGDGTRVTHELHITVTGPDTAHAFDTGIDLATLFEEDGEDEVLGLKWTYKKGVIK